MKRLLLLLSFLCIAHIASAQDHPRLNDLQKKLQASRPDTGRIYIQLQLAEFEILKHGSFKTDLDSADGFIKDAELLNRSVRSPDAAGYITMEKANLAKEQGDTKTGKALAEKAIQQLSVTNNKYLLAKAYLGLSAYYDFMNPDEDKKKEAYIQTAANLFGAAGYFEEEAFCYKNLADIIQDNDTAFKKLNIAMSIYKSIHYKRLQGIYDLFSQYYFGKSDYEKSLQYDLAALKTEADLHEHDGTMVEIENHIGNLYSHLGDYPNQVRFYKMAVVDSRAEGDIANEVVISLNLAYAYIAHGQLSNANELLAALSANDLSQVPPLVLGHFYRCKLKIYVTLKDFAGAGKVATELIQLLKNNAIGIQGAVDANNALFNYYMQVKQYADAKKYLLINDEAIKKTPSPDNFKNANNNWFSLDTALHDYKAAVYRSLVKENFADSIYKLNNLKEIHDLQNKFDEKQKESQISFLQQKSTLEAKNLQQANIVKDYTIGNTILLFIVAGLLYRQNRLKQRANKIISTKNGLLQHLVDEKEWLLKEVHHRVKNNLHTVICLLESQAAYLENDALKAIENSQHRIYAMSLIHQKLYQSEDIKTIDMDVYLKEFIQYLDDSFGNPSNIRLRAEIEPIKLGVAQAIPVGLIINEAVTNSYKYAFPDDRKGVVEVTFHQSENLIALIICDNGIGMVEAGNSDDTGSLGMDLIKGLARDLNGQIKIESKNGMCINILFEVNLFDRAVSNAELPIGV